MTVWTNKFQIIEIIVGPIFVLVVNLQYFKLAITAPLAICPPIFHQPSF